MKIKSYQILAACFLTYATVNAQTGFSDDPMNAIFETGDTDRFWKAFDKMETSKENPFADYMKNGSPGVKGFTEFRIINADSLYTMVRKRKEDYLKSRNVLAGVGQKEKRARAIYSAMKYWHPEAKFPPVYFVYGRFNSGGTVSKDGIIIGTEMLNNLDGVMGLVAHELIHFQQNIKGDGSLLKNTLMEGGADFISEMISGENINTGAFRYGEAHLEALCREFVTRLKNDDNTDWLYGTSKKDDRPNDLGYWMGYKISESYFMRQKDKHKAIHDILNIEDPLEFLKESGFLDPYIREYTKNQKMKFEDFYKPYSDETHEVTFTVSVPDKNDEVYITGNQPELGNWTPSSIKMNRKSARERSITLKIHLPAQFKFTKGNWEIQADVKGKNKWQNIRIEEKPSKPVHYEITNWSDNQ